MNRILYACARPVLVSALLLCGIVPSQAQPGIPFEAEHPPNIESAFAKLPLAFEENQGQADPAVKFLARGSGYQLFLTAQEAVMIFNKGNQAATDYQTAVIRMRFEGANKTPVVKGVAPLAYKTN